MFYELTTGNFVEDSLYIIKHSFTCQYIEEKFLLQLFDLKLYTNSTKNQIR